MTKDGEIFILKMPSVKIEDLAKGMLEVFKKRFSNSKISSKIFGEVIFLKFTEYFNISFSICQVV